MEDFDISELSALLAEQTQRLGLDHLDVLATRHLLARRFAEQSAHAQAVTLYEQLVIDRTRVIGESHRDTLSSRHNLALCLAWCGQFKKSRAIFEEVIRLLEETYGSGDDDTIRTRQWYLNDVISELEVPETVIKQYEALFETISRESKKRVARDREIRKQYENFSEKNGKRPTVSARTMRGEEALIKLITDKKKEQTKSKPFKYEPKLESWHAKLAWGELGGDLSDWQSAIVSDARDIALDIVGRTEIETEEFLFERFHCDPSKSQSSRKFQILKKLVESGSGSALRLAGQIAVAYVDFAYFSLHISGADSEVSGSKIDDLRRKLREILGPNIDTTSDAEIEFEKSFQEIVGLESVKKDLMGFIRVLTENKRQLARGAGTEPPRLHLVFAGNPGTGKTTVARLYGHLLYQLGFLGSDKFKEIDKSKLVGPHTGETELRARAVIDEATPGVLFIDEAYSLNDPFSDVKGPGQRALEVILKGMEDNRATLAVIFAGYSKEMDDLMKVNPGLPSRIGKTINFPNYSLDELIDVARRAASKRGLRFDDGAEQKLRGVVEALISKENFGNAREIESLVEEAQRNLANRLAPLDDLATSNEKRLILESDIPTREKPISRKYGFN